MFHHHCDETLRIKRVENTTRSGVFLTNFEVFPLVMNTVSNAWYYFLNKIILEGEIKDVKMSSFSSDFQTLIKYDFPLYFLYELLMSLRMNFERLLASFEKPQFQSVLIFFTVCPSVPSFSFSVFWAVIFIFNMFHSIWRQFPMFEFWQISSHSSFKNTAIEKAKIIHWQQHSPQDITA